jgi:DNA-binding Xre family transcriptional regulator
VIKKMGYQWRLRHLMAERDLFQTSDLVPLLAERGIRLSREQVYRLVTQPPQRMSMDTLVALCDILHCTPNDLITLEVVNTQVRKTAGDQTTNTTGASVTPRRTVVRRPEMP